MQRLALFLLAISILAGGSVAFGQKNNRQAQRSRQTAAAPVADKKSALTAASHSLEAQILQEINQLRQNPATYIGYLKEQRKNYAGNELRLPGETAIVTSEGVAALEEAVAFLKRMKPARNLTVVAGLNSAAHQHLQDLLKNNKTGHLGSDGSSPDARLQRHGSWSGEVKELISYFAPTPRRMILNWLIDDGVKTRGHRTSLLKDSFQSIGITTGNSSTRGKMCILVLTESFTSKP